MYDYVKNPEAITQQSMQKISELSDLSQLDPSLHSIAIRMIHTCGQVGIIEQLSVCGDVMLAGRSALIASKPILCDVEMVKNGLSKRSLNQEPLCFLNHKDVAARAKKLGITRTMCALSHWQPYLANAIIVIGNAPTALFRYLELLEEGAARPALIIAMPVGFIGAAESKQALIEYASQSKIAAITLQGRSGGSALAAAVFNAIAMNVQSSLSYDGH